MAYVDDPLREIIQRHYGAQTFHQCRYGGLLGHPSLREIQTLLR